MTKPKGGRPSKYCPQVAAEIWILLASGYSLVKICKDDAMPCRQTVLEWMRTRDDFRADIARAREIQGDTFFDQIIDLSDSMTPENANAVRVQIWAKQWLAAKLRPKIYGDKVVNEVTGADGGSIKVESVVTDEDRVQALISFMNRNGLTFGPVKGEAKALARDPEMVKVEPKAVYHGPTGICKK